MLPGFNHNVRYKDRVFHVQTEDTGLGQPFLVTQVFIGGHLVAIEKTSYADVLESPLDQDKRNDQIRSRMQDQHKRLLKNLVKHAYDDRIALYLGSPNVDSPNDARPPMPIEAIVAAEPLPRADNAISLSSAVESKTKPVADEIPEGDLFKVFDEELLKQVPWSPTNQNGSLPPLDPALFDPRDWVDAMPLVNAPGVPPLQTNSASRVSGQNSVGKAVPPRTSDRTTPDRTLHPADTMPRDRRPRPPPEAPTVIGPRPPPITDTLVDVGLPGALQEQLGQAKAALEQARKNAQQARGSSSRNSDPRAAHFHMPRPPSPTPKKREHERETQIDLALRRRASSGRSQRPTTSDNADTLLDIDADEIQEYIARKKRERADKSPTNNESWGDAVDTIDSNDSKRPSIVVVERSLDEVILSYLADED